MRALFNWTILLCLVSLNKNIYSQTLSPYSLPEPVKIELDRLNEAYNILDKFSNNVWEGWNDYLSYPILMNFPNGLRVVVGHQNPPAPFVLYPYLKIHGLTIHIDTSNLNDYNIELPLLCGGGISDLGTFNRKPVKIVNLLLSPLVSSEMIDSAYFKAERHIMIFIHELMHCYEEKILKKQMSNLRIIPDLNYAVYSDIEGQALSMAFEQTSLEETIPYLKDFCVARSWINKGLHGIEKEQLSANELSEGLADFSEFIILKCLKGNLENHLSFGIDPEYNQFANSKVYIDDYLINLKKISGKTLDFFGKIYSYGCFQALLLERYFPDWQKEVSKGASLDKVLRNKLSISPSDSLSVINRFKIIYNIDKLKSKHNKIITQRDETFEMFKERKGRSYIINTSLVQQFIPSIIDTSALNYNLGQRHMYPKGIGRIHFDEIDISLDSIPVEIYNSFNLKVIDTNTQNENKPYSLTYKTNDLKGNYYNAIIETPVFTLKAPKVSITENSEEIIIFIQTRTLK